MNGGAGRQELRSGSTAVHHQRQLSDNNFLDDGSSTGTANRWLQSAGLQHLQSSSANPLPPLQDYSLYGDGGGGVQGGRMHRKVQRSFNGGGTDYYMEPATPPGAHRALTQKKNGDESSGDFRGKKLCQWWLARECTARGGTRCGGWRYGRGSTESDAGGGALFWPMGFAAVVVGCWLRQQHNWSVMELSATSYGGRGRFRRWFPVSNMVGLSGVYIH